MGISILDEEGTKENILDNSETENEAKESFKKLRGVLGQVDAGAEPTMINLYGNYITSKENAKIYKEMYGFQFVEMAIAEL